MIVPWSYSLFSAMETCPHQMFRKFILKDIPYQQTDEQKEGTRRHKALMRRLREQAPLPDDMQQFEPACAAMVPWGPEVELKLGMVEGDGMGFRGCDFFARNVWGRGEIDVLIRNIQTGVAVIYDWKPKDSKYRGSFELELHALLLRMNYPSIKTVKGRYFFMDTGETSQEYNLSDIISTEQKVRHLCGIIEQYRANNVWPKQPGVLCGWCRVGDCVHRKERERANP